MKQEEDSESGGVQVCRGSLERFHYGYQFQKAGGQDFARHAFGASLNYQVPVATKISVGLKYQFYTGVGNTQKALDCMECSNISHEYSGHDVLFTATWVVTPKWYIKWDQRLSNSNSRETTKVDDPYRVGLSLPPQTTVVVSPRFTVGVGYVF